MKGIVGQASLRLVRTGTAPAAAGRASRVRVTPVQPSLVWGATRARPGAAVSYVVRSTRPR